jgi:transposase
MLRRIFGPKRDEVRRECRKLHNEEFNPLKPELNIICYLLALLGAHNFLHVSRIRVKLLTLR